MTFRVEISYLNGKLFDLKITSFRYNGFSVEINVFLSVEAEVTLHTLSFSVKLTNFKTL